MTSRSRKENQSSETTQAAKTLVDVLKKQFKLNRKEKTYASSKPKILSKTEVSQSRRKLSFNQGFLRKIYIFWVFLMNKKYINN